MERPGSKLISGSAIENSLQSFLTLEEIDPKHVFDIEILLFQEYISRRILRRD